MTFNQFKAKQIIDKDNVTKAEANPLGLNNNIFLNAEFTQVAILASDSTPASLLINGDLYTNTSDTSISISGSAGKRHIFAAAGTNHNFTLEAVLPADNAPSNSRFIGVISWDGSQVTSIDSSLSGLLEKEQIGITATQNSITLSEISYDSNEIPLIFVNGLRESNITVVDNVVTFTTNLVSGDMVHAVKVRNNSTFSRPVSGSVAPTADYEWLFNDGVGNTAVSTLGAQDFTISGSPIWGSGYIELDSFNSTSPNFHTTSPDSNLWGGLQTFSIASWITPLRSYNNSGNLETFLTIGNGNNDLNNWNIYASSSTGDKITWAVSQGIFGGPGTGLTSNASFTVSNKILVIMTYKYNGNSNINDMALTVTSDGITWDTVSSATAVPISAKSGFQLASDFVNVGYHNSNYKYHRLDVYNNYILTTNDNQAIWDRGSEG